MTMLPEDGPSAKGFVLKQNRIFSPYLLFHSLLRASHHHHVLVSGNTADLLPHGEAWRDPHSIGRGERAHAPH